MTCWIEKTPDGEDTIFCDSAEVGCDVRKQALNPGHLYMQVATGHLFVTSQPLPRIAPHDAEMAEHWFKERGADLAPDIFAGEPDG